jgi:hypothetical protein
MSEIAKPTGEVEAEMHILTLRGLYGDLRDCLHDPGERRELWAQIQVANRRLAELLHGPALEPAQGSAA